MAYRDSRSSAFRGGAAHQAAAKLAAFLLVLATAVLFSDGLLAGDARRQNTAPAPAAAELLEQGPVLFGAFDPQGVFANDPDVRIDSIYVIWTKLDRPNLTKRLAAALRRKRWVMLNIEPKPWPRSGQAGADALLPDIAAGKFDREIRSVCSMAGAFKGPILIRWGQEMENPQERYPWAGKEPESFIAAYRYFVTRCRALAPRAAYVWAPNGDKRLTRYYPGGDYVDVVGLSLWGYQAYEEYAYGKGHERSFQQAFGERYARVVGYGKPIIITQLGAAGDEAFRTQWFAGMFSTVLDGRIFPRLRAVVYFNDVEPDIWPYLYTSPDWRIGPGWFRPTRRYSSR
jgi:beta-mannanase